MFPVLHYVPGVLLDPDAFARRAVSSLLNFFLSALLLFNSYIIFVLDLGFVSPPTRGTCNPSFTDIYAIVYNIFYASTTPDIATSPPGYHCLPHTFASAFAVCVDDATYNGVASLANAAVTAPSLEDVAVAFVLCVLALPEIPDLALVVLKVAWPQTSHVAPSTEVDEELDGLRNKLKLYREKTSLTLAANEILHEELNAEKSFRKVISNKIISLCSVRQDGRARENKAASVLASTRETKQLRTLASVERQKDLQAELVDRGRQLDNVRKHLTQVRLDIKNLKDTEKAEEVQAAEARKRESSLSEAQLAEAQTMFDHTALAYEFAIADAADARSRSYEEAAHLEGVAKAAREENNKVLEQVNIRLKAAEDDLAQLIDIEHTLESAKKSAQREYESLIIQISNVKAVIRKANDDNTTAQAALLGSCVDHYHADVQTAESLEKEVADLENSLRDAILVHDGYEGSLEFSVAEHRFHMETCNRNSESIRQQLQFLDNWVSADQVALDALQAEALALPSQLTRMENEFEEEMQGLAWRLSQVSQGYAAEEARTKELKMELNNVQTARAKENRCHRLAILSYHRIQKLDEDLADDLIRAIDEQKPRLEALETRTAELQEAQDALDAAQIKFDVTIADHAEVDKDLVVKDAEILALTAQLGEARRRSDVFRREVEGQEKVYAKRLAELKHDNDMFCGRIGVEAKIQRAERSGKLDRVKLMEAAVVELTPPGFERSMQMGYGSMPFRDISNFVSDR